MWSYINWCRKTFNKCQHSFITKAHKKLGIKGKILNLIKTISKKPTISIILNAERLNDFSRVRTSQGCLLSLLLFRLVLEVITSGVRQENKIKGTQKSKEEIKLSLSANGMTIDVENSMWSLKKFLELLSEFSKVSEYKIKNQSCLYYQ